MKHIFIQNKNLKDVDCLQRNTMCPLVQYASRRDIAYDVEIVKSGEYNIEFTKQHVSNLYSEYSNLFNEICTVCKRCGNDK